MPSQLPRAAPRESLPAGPTSQGAPVSANLLSLAAFFIGAQISRGLFFDLAISDLLVAAYLVTRGARLRLPRTQVLLPAVLLCVAFALGLLPFVQATDRSLEWAGTRAIGALTVVGYLLAFSDGYRRVCHSSFWRPMVLGVALTNLLIIVPLTRPAASALFIQKADSRLSGGLVDPNSNGTLLAVALVIGMAEWTRSREQPVRLQTYLLGTATLVNLYGLYLTLSRGAMLSLAAAAAIFVLLTSQRRPAVLAQAISATVLLVAVAIMLNLDDRAQDNFSERPPDNLSARFVDAEYGITAFTDSPFLGAGLGASYADTGATIHATTFYLAGELGMVGLAPFVALQLLALSTMARAIRSRSRSSPSNDAAFVALVTMAVASFTFEALLQRHWWILLAYAYSLKQAGR